MARIAGIDLPKGKRGVVGLTYIHGIGSSRATHILDEAKVSEDKKVQDSFFLFFFVKADFKYVLTRIGNSNINKGISNGRIFKKTIKLILGFWL